MTPGIRVHVDENIGILTIENPPVNALSVVVQERLRDAMATAMSESAIQGIVLAGAGTTFVAGADLKELRRAALEGVSGSILPEVLEEIEAASKPVVAAIQGTALGGGLELALAAHYRIASADSSLGQPEVKLGLIPGAGGTQRLPRLAGVDMALEMCVFGNPVDSVDAHRFGVVDRIAEGNLLEAAIAFAKEVVPLGPRRSCSLTEKLGTRESNAPLFAAARKKARRARRVQLAPLAAIQAIEAATELPFEEGCRREREAFMRLLGSSQARALIHVFFAERAAGKVPDMESEAAILPINSAAIVGAGTMGRGIAMCFADAAIPVALKDTNREALDAGMKSIQALYGRSVEKGRLAPDEMETRLSRIRPQLDYGGFDTADMVVEAVYEDLGVKRAVFAELAGVTNARILATNTSYLNVDEIAQACGRPENVVGLHFFSPANVMRLLEVVPGKQTNRTVTARAFRLARRLGKRAVYAGNCPGFIGNRMLRVYRREAVFLLEEGASPQQVDSALEAWGMAMGPLAVQDLAGIDIAMGSRGVFEALDPPGLRNSKVMEMLYTEGRLGQKTGAGWYRYEEDRMPSPDEEVDAIIKHAAQESGIARRSVSDEEIVERTIYALINEGSRVLEEGCARRASDIDLVYIHGYGFPSHRGGPMHYADEVGLKTVRDRIRRFHVIHGDGWETSLLLDRLADEGGSFGAWDKSQMQSARSG